MRYLPQLVLVKRGDNTFEIHSVSPQKISDFGNSSLAAYLREHHEAQATYFAMEAGGKYLIKVRTRAAEEELECAEFYDDVEPKLREAVMMHVESWKRIAMGHAGLMLLTGSSREEVHALERIIDGYSILDLS